MGILHDASLDARARPIIEKERGAVSVDLLERAALIEESPSPAMLEETGQWIAIANDLAAAGMTPEEILRVAVSAHDPDEDRFGPTPEMLGHLFDIDAGLAIARAVCEELVENPRGTYFQHIANVALARLAKDNAIDPRFEALFDWSPTEPTQLRTIIGSLPPDRRESFVLSRSGLSTTKGVNVARNAAFKIDKLLWVLDLAPGARAALDTLLAAAKGDSEHAALAAEIAAGTPRTLEPRPTAEARAALAYSCEESAKAKRASDIDGIAQDAYRRAITVDAPELATVATWTTAGAKRQKQIATAVAGAVSAQLELACKLVDIASYGGPPIATLAIGKQRFCLVPGGTFEMGFSEEEEAAVRAQAEANEGCGNHWELYEHLFENVDAMRPITHVRVGPLLVAQAPGTTYDLDEATDELAESPFRVPSEAEWEYCARGGRSRELTYRGDVVPDHADWFRQTYQLGAKGANAFGLWGFGYEPEVCADVWHETLDDHPTDGSPRTGDGPRVVRGGAAQLFPWQACGEWHMLLSAFRMPSSVWKFTLALRFVLGIDCGAHAGTRKN